VLDALFGISPRVRCVVREAHTGIVDVDDEPPPSERKPSRASPRARCHAVDFAEGLLVYEGPIQDLIDELSRVAGDRAQISHAPAFWPREAARGGQEAWAE